MHHKADKKIDEYLTELIDNITVKDGWLDIYPKSIWDVMRKIDDIVYKSKSEWIEKGEIRSLIISSINNKI
ncbi:MAG: hypothetical protein IH948_06695, partial [Bacteroidetes bacterium]|nr:hypothetical protein [Bacteroidota bacterium]